MMFFSKTTVRTQLTLLIYYYFLSPCRLCPHIQCPSCVYIAPYKPNYCVTWWTTSNSYNSLYTVCQKIPVEVIYLLQFWNRKNVKIWQQSVLTEQSSHKKNNFCFNTLCIKITEVLDVIIFVIYKQVLHF